jgi:chromosome segregation ATPase
MRAGLLLLAPFLLLAGCAAQPCDPRADRNIFQVGNCVVGGGYQSRVDVLQQRVAVAEAEQAAAARDLEAARARRDSVAAEQARLRNDLATERTRTARLEREIGQARDAGRLNRQRLAELEGEAARLRQEQEALRNAPPTEDLRRRNEELSRRRQAIEGSLADMNRELRRE